MAFAEISKIQSCELLITAHDQQQWWPTDKQFKKTFTTLVYRHAKLWTQYDFVCDRTPTDSKLHQDASSQLHALLRKKLLAELNTAIDYEDADALLWEVERLCRTQKYVHAKRLTSVIAQIRQQMRQLATSFYELKSLLSKKWICGEERKKLWNRTLMQAADAAELQLLTPYEPTPGLCKQTALDRCNSIAACQAAAKAWRNDDEEQVFAARAIELAPSFADLMGVRFRWQDSTLYIRYMERLLSLARTEDLLLELIERCDNVQKVYREPIRHVRKQAVDRLQALRKNQLQAKTTFVECWEIVNNQRHHLSHRHSAFAAACPLAVASAEFWLLYQETWCHRHLPEGFDPVERGLDAVVAVKDVEQLERWAVELAPDHPQKTRAQELFLQHSELEMAT